MTPKNNESKSRYILSARQVLADWLVSQIGPATRVRPKGFRSMFDGGSRVWADANRALIRVSEIEGYQVVKPYLLEWVQVNGLTDIPQVVLVAEFIGRLEESLKGDPVFRSTDPDLENAVLAVCSLDCATFARQAKVDTRTVRRWAENGNLRDCYRFKGKWHIPEPEMWRFLREREYFRELEKNQHNRETFSA